MKKGFTLTELLAVVVIIALISIIAIPSITSLLKKQDKELKETIEQTIKVSAEKYVRDNPKLYPMKKDDVYNASYANPLTVKVLIDNNYLDKSLLTSSSYYSDYYVEATDTWNITITMTVVDPNKSVTTEVKYGE